MALSDAEARDRFLGVSAQSMQGIAARDLGASPPPDFPRELAREILADFERELKGVDGIREALAELGARVCGASSSSNERIRASLRIVGYARLFEPNVFSAAEVARGASRRAAIRCALLGKLISGPVTDEVTAEPLLRR